MYFNRQAVKTKGDICESVLAPRPPKGGIFELRKA
jgi:hypothetical protein